MGGASTPEGTEATSNTAFIFDPTSQQLSDLNTRIVNGTGVVVNAHCISQNGAYIIGDGNVSPIVTEETNTYPVALIETSCGE
jgi:hypothetical protein